MHTTSAVANPNTIKMPELMSSGIDSSTNDTIAKPAIRADKLEIACTPAALSSVRLLLCAPLVVASFLPQVATRGPCSHSSAAAAAASREPAEIRLGTQQRVLRVLKPFGSVAESSLLHFVHHSGQREALLVQLHVLAPTW